MNNNMDAWIKQAVTFGIMRREKPINLTEDERDIMPFPLPVGRGIIVDRPYVRSGPAKEYDDVSGGAPLPNGHEVVVLGRNTKAEGPGNADWVAVFYRGDINWIFKDGVKLPEGVDWSDLPILNNERKLTYDFSIAAQAEASWFPIMAAAAPGR